MKFDICTIDNSCTIPFTKPKYNGQLINKVWWNDISRLVFRNSCHDCTMYNLYLGQNNYFLLPGIYAIQIPCTICTWDWKLLVDRNLCYPDTIYNLYLGQNNYFLLPEIYFIKIPCTICTKDRIITSCYQKFMLSRYHAQFVLMTE